WAVRRHGFGVRASAAGLTATTAAEAVYALACSGARERRGGGQHFALWGSVAGALALQVAVNEWPPLRRLLHAAPLDRRDYAASLLAAVLPTLWAAVRTRVLPERPVAVASGRLGGAQSPASGTAGGAGVFAGE